MGLVLQLPDDLEKELSRKASQLGLSLAEYAMRLLSDQQRAAAPPHSQSGADLVAYWQREGLVGTRPDIAESQVHARELRARAEHREK
jgi:hypothetical protein